jgi:hypothetical protein
VLTRVFAGVRVSAVVRQWTRCGRVLVCANSGGGFDSREHGLHMRVGSALRDRSHWHMGHRG